jgi:predicted transposase YbfD/YdcC
LQLLKTLEIEGCIVTIDAMEYQKRISETIVEKGADYVFSLNDDNYLSKILRAEL